MDKRHAAPFDERGRQVIEQAGGGQCAEGGRHAPVFDRLDDRRDEGKAGAQVNRHLPPGAGLEDQRADAGAEQRQAGIEPGEQRHQHRRAESDEENLRAGHRRAPDRIGRPLRGRNHRFIHRPAPHSPPYLVPKILSPASPSPGMM